VLSSQVPRVAIVEGGNLGSVGGMGQTTPPMLNELQRLLGSRCQVVSTDGRQVRELEPATLTLPMIDRLRRRLIRESQERFPIPVLRWLAGEFDVYCHIGLSLRPRVPYERLVLAIFDLAGMRWSDEARLPGWTATVAHRAARVLTISEFSKGELCREFDIPEERVAVTYCGCDHDRFHPLPMPGDAARVASAAERSDAPYVLVSGGLTQRKNVRRMLEAFARYSSISGFSPRLIVTGVQRDSVVGAGYVELARQLGVGREVLLPGYVPDQVMPSLYRRAAAVLVPSLYEGFGLPILEGMASGSPVLTSNAASLPEVAGDAALSVDATSVDALADGLARILTDEPLRATLRTRGIERAATFTWQRCAQQTIAVYQDVAARADERSRQRRGIRARLSR